MPTGQLLPSRWRSDRITLRCAFGERAAQFIVNLTKLSDNLIQRREVMPHMQPLGRRDLQGVPPRTVLGAQGVAFRWSDLEPVAARCADDSTDLRFDSTVCIRTSRRRWARSDRNSCTAREIHPFSEMMPFDDAEDADLVRIVEPYFKAEPYIDYGGLDYVVGSQYTSTKPQYWFVHKLADILMGLIENQISIEHFSEYGTDISAGHKRIEQARAGIPLSYILIGRKQNAS